MNIFARIDGIRASFMFDTGADHIFIGESLLKRLSAKTKRKFKHFKKTLCTGPGGDHISRGPIAITIELYGRIFLFILQVMISILI